MDEERESLFLIFNEKIFINFTKIELKKQAG